MAQAVLPGAPNPVGFRAATVSGTALPLSDASWTDGTHTGIPAGAAYALVTIEDQDCRWSCAVTPTSSLGTLAPGSVGLQPIELCGAAMIAGFKIIRVSSDAKVTVEYFGSGYALKP